MDLEEQHEIDRAGQAVRPKVHGRPWRALVALAVALVAAIVSHEAGSQFRGWLQPGFQISKLVTVTTALGFGFFAVIAVVGLSGKARDTLRPMTGSAHAAVVRYAGVLVGSIAALVITLELLKLPIGQLLVGGALTTILIGIAAQQSLSNVFAGIVLLLSRPFGVGDLIHLRSGALNGPIEGTVTEVGITYVRLDTGNGILHLPNSQVLASAVARIHPARPDVTAEPNGGQPSSPPAV